MNRKVSVVPAALAFALAICIPKATAAPAKAPVSRAAVRVPAAAPLPPQRRERHPVIVNALRQLQETKANLEKYGAHDFGGHRVAAIRHIDQAIGELREALRYDKH